MLILNFVLTEYINELVYLLAGKIFQYKKLFPKENSAVTALTFKITYLFPCTCMYLIIYYLTRISIPRSIQLIYVRFHHISLDDHRSNPEACTRDSRISWKVINNLFNLRCHLTQHCNEQRKQNGFRFFGGFCFEVTLQLPVVFDFGMSLLGAVVIT